MKVGGISSGPEVSSPVQVTLKLWAEDQRCINNINMLEMGCEECTQNADISKIPGPIANLARHLWAPQYQFILEDELVGVPDPPAWFSTRSGRKDRQATTSQPNQANRS